MQQPLLSDCAANIIKPASQLPGKSPGRNLRRPKTSTLLKKGVHLQLQLDQNESKDVLIKQAYTNQIRLRDITPKRMSCIGHANSLSRDAISKKVQKSQDAISKAYCQTPLL